MNKCLAVDLEIFKSNNNKNIIEKFEMNKFRFKLDFVWTEEMNIMSVR